MQYRYLNKEELWFKFYMHAPRLRMLSEKKIQDSKKSIRTLALEYNVNPKTIVKWRSRESVNDNKFGSKKLRTVLTTLEENAICVFRKSTNLPLDDCYIALKETIANLSRSNLHRCLKRHNLNILPKTEDEILLEQKRKKQKFKDYSMGYFHIDITKITLENNDPFYLFVAIDRITKFTIARIYKNQTIENSVEFLQIVIDKCQYKIHRILTDNGVQFTYALLAKHLRPKAFHAFDIVCKKHAIKHKLTKFRHPWTNGQVERTNRTIKDATVKTYHYDNLEQLQQHLKQFMLVYNFAKKLKSLKFKTPFEFIIEQYKIHPKLFHQNPYHYSRGLNICSVPTSSGSD